MRLDVPPEWDDNGANSVGSSLMSKNPHDVFTPREPKVTAMYVDRPVLEERLVQALQGTQHILVHGDSGTGKSWLYKRVLARLGAEWVVANLANAARLGSITAELKNNVDREGTPTKTGYSESKDARASVGVLEGSLAHENEYALGTKEPFERALELLRKKAGHGKLTCMVLDNLEAILSSPDRMEELANLVILLDDERYAAYRVKLLIVGVPGRVRDYYNRTPNRAPVANRLIEIPEVSRLSRPQTWELVNRGFTDELQYTCSAEALRIITEHVAWVTDRVPQRIHEYCLELALVGEKYRLLEPGMLEVADKRWLKISLSNTYSVIENLMNERETKVGRRNQLLFLLGMVDDDELRLADVEIAMRSEFPKSTEGTSLNISGGLAELARGESPVLRRSPKGDSWTFADPRYRMCIRAMLVKDPIKEQISKRPISDV